MSVSHASLPRYATEDFLVLRDDDGKFLASLCRAALDRILTPEIHPPWVLAEDHLDHGTVFDFLDDTLFASFDCAQMLATVREIEERAWRVADGRLHVGFQRVAAFEVQAEVYEQLTDRGDLPIRIFLDADWVVNVSERIPATVSDADEIGDFWFLALDGAGSVTRKCAPIAEEREPGFYGFWTYDPAIADDAFESLDDEY